MANGGIIGPTQDPSFGSETVNTFTSSGTFSSGTFTSADVLVVGGGGAAKTPAGSMGGGGGGGYRYFPGHTISASTDYPITVGSGGSDNSASGS